MRKIFLFKCIFRKKKEIYSNIIELLKYISIIYIYTIKPTKLKREKKNVIAY